jgi:hypothetical protein
MIKENDLHFSLVIPLVELHSQTTRHDLKSSSNSFEDEEIESLKSKVYESSLRMSEKTPKT